MESSDLRVIEEVSIEGHSVQNVGESELITEKASKDKYYSESISSVSDELWSVSLSSREIRDSELDSLSHLVSSSINQRSKEIDLGLDSGIKQIDITEEEEDDDDDDDDDDSSIGQLSLSNESDESDELNEDDIEEKVEDDESSVMMDLG